MFILNLMCCMTLVYFFCFYFEAQCFHSCCIKCATWINLSLLHFLRFVSFGFILFLKMNIINPTVYNTAFTLWSQLQQVAIFVVVVVFLWKMNGNNVCHCEFVCSVSLKCVLHVPIKMYYGFSTSLPFTYHFHIKGALSQSSHGTSRWPKWQLLPEYVFFQATTYSI